MLFPHRADSKYPVKNNIPFNNFIIVTISGIISGILYFILKNNLITVPVKDNLTNTIFKIFAGLNFSFLSFSGIFIWSSVFTVIYLITWILFALFCNRITRVPLSDYLKKDSYTYLLAFTIPIILLFRFNVKAPYWLHIITGLYILMVFIKFRYVFKNLFLSGISNIGLFFIMFLLLFMINLAVSTRCITGDEPHYLIMTESLLQDGDLNLVNNYENKDYYKFFNYPIDKHTIDYSINGNNCSYSIHEPGMCFILLPGYLLAGAFGALITMNIFAALLTVNMYLLYIRLGVENNRSLKLSVLLSLIVPISLYSQQLFPEILATLFMLYSFRKIHEANFLNSYDYLKTVIPLALLPWLCISIIKIAGGAVMSLPIPKIMAKKP